MSEKESNVRLESQLHDLYNLPEPDLAFSRRLRAQILARAESRKSSRTARLWSGLTTAGRAAFSLGGVALLVGLVLLGANLLAGWLGGQNQVSSSTPASAITATPRPSKASPQTAYQLPRLSPSACDTLITPQPSNAAYNRPGKLLGGGVVKSGDFQINLFLFCNPAYQPESQDTFSEVGGLGIYQSMWYNGPDIDEPRSTTTVYRGGQAYTQEVPAVALTRGAGMSEISGFIMNSTAIPDWSADELPMRYIYTIRGAEGKLYGATLSFRLVNGPDGFTVRDTAVKALNEAEMAQTEALPGFQPTYPTAEPAKLHPLLGELVVLQERQRAWLYTGSGWYLQRMQWKIDGDPYADIPPQDRPASVFARDYFNDIWYKVDERGTLVGSVNRQTRPDERYGEMILREGSYVMPGAGRQEGVITEPPVFDEGALGYGVEAVRRGGAITKLELAGAVQYTITTSTHETQAVFDPATGKLLEVRNYSIDKDGEKRLYSSAKTIILERVDEPPQDILNLFE